MTPIEKIAIRLLKEFVLAAQEVSDNVDADDDYSSIALLKLANAKHEAKEFLKAYD